MNDHGEPVLQLWCPEERATEAALVGVGIPFDTLVPRQ